MSTTFLMPQSTFGVVYQVQGEDLLTVPTRFLNRIRGVYGWYVRPREVAILGPEYRLSANEPANRTPDRIYLYVGSVKAGNRKSVAVRFVGERLGPQISSDKNHSFDTDFTVSYVVEFLCNQGLNVYFDVLSTIHGGAEELRLAKDCRPILQKVGEKSVRLHPDFKRKITARNLEEEITEVRDATLCRLRKWVAEQNATRRQAIDKKKTDSS